MASPLSSFLRRAEPRRRRGFTLAEVLVGSAVAALVLAGLLTSLVLIARSTQRLREQFDMAAQSREVLNYFSRDVYSASAVDWTSATTLRLTTPTGVVTYAYDASNRTLRYTPASGNARVLASGLRDFSFTAFDNTGTQLTLASNLTAASTSTRSIQFSGLLGREVGGRVRSSEPLTSPRLVLRRR